MLEAIGFMALVLPSLYVTVAPVLAFFVVYALGGNSFDWRLVVIYIVAVTLCWWTVVALNPYEISVINK